jgi:hypothetical protein
MYRDIPSYPYNGRFPPEKLHHSAHVIAHPLTAWEQGYYSVMNAGNFAWVIIPSILFLVSLVMLCISEWNGASTLITAASLFFSVSAVIAAAIALMYGIARVLRS